MRCHYCNEFGHFIRECAKKNRDENKTGHFNRMSMDYYEDDLYTGEDYDNDVFATFRPLNTSLIMRKYGNEYRIQPTSLNNL